MCYWNILFCNLRFILRGLFWWFILLSLLPPFCKPLWLVCLLEGSSLSLLIRWFLSKCLWWFFNSLLSVLLLLCLFLTLTLSGSLASLSTTYSVVSLLSCDPCLNTGVEILSWVDVTETLRNLIRSSEWVSASNQTCYLVKFFFCISYSISFSARWFLILFFQDNHFRNVDKFLYKFRGCLIFDGTFRIDFIFLLVLLVIIISIIAFIFETAICTEIAMIIIISTLLITLIIRVSPVNIFVRICCQLTFLLFLGISLKFLLFSGFSLKFLLFSVLSWKFLLLSGLSLKFLLFSVLSLLESRLFLNNLWIYVNCHLKPTPWLSYQGFDLI